MNFKSISILALTLALSLVVVHAKEEASNEVAFDYDNADYGDLHDFDDADLVDNEGENGDVDGENEGDFA